MSEPNEPAPEEPQPPTPRLLSELRDQLRPALFSVPLLTLITGALFPVVLAAVARPLLRFQANGSLVSRDGVVIGSDLIGQSFVGPGYFHSRPSAAGDGYDGTSSGATNLGPANPRLRASVQELANDYRRHNDLPADAVVPIDAVTRSGSGLDPHISPENAALQVPRVARERNLSEEHVRRLVAEHTVGRQFGFLGQPRVAVLALNVALDREAPLTPNTAPR
jgi:K+-transporting ATPase ATPase C chain